MKSIKNLLALFALSASVQAFAVNCPSIEFVQSTWASLNYVEQQEDGNYVAITMSPTYDAPTNRDWYVGTGSIVANDETEALHKAQENVKGTHHQNSSIPVKYKGYYVCAYLGSLKESNPVLALTPESGKANLTLSPASHFVNAFKVFKVK
jgi:hypothetical protein